MVGLNIRWSSALLGVARCPVCMLALSASAVPLLAPQISGTSSSVACSRHHDARRDLRCYVYLRVLLIDDRVACSVDN